VENKMNSFYNNNIYEMKDEDLYKKKAKKSSKKQKKQ
jgi:hypothetical protein